MRTKSFSYGLAGVLFMLLPQQVFADSLDVAFENTLAYTANGFLGDGKTIKYFYNANGTLTSLEKGKLLSGTWERTTLEDGRPGHCTKVPEASNRFQRDVCGPIGDNIQVGDKWTFSPIFGLKITGEMVSGRDGE